MSVLTQKIREAVDRSIIDRYAVIRRTVVGRWSIGVRLMVFPLYARLMVGRCLDGSPKSRLRHRLIIDQIAVDHQAIISRLSVDYLFTSYRKSTKHLLTQQSTIRLGLQYIITVGSKLTNHKWQSLFKSQPITYGKT